jgi:hypothetical protein
VHDKHFGEMSKKSRYAFSEIHSRELLHYAAAKSIIRYTAAITWMIPHFNEWIHNDSLRHHTTHHIDVPKSTDVNKAL